MDPVEKKPRVQQLAESILSTRKVLRLHESGERNIDAEDRELSMPWLPKMRSQRWVKGLHAWLPVMLSAALAAKPSKSKPKPKSNTFVINVDTLSSSDDVSEELKSKIAKIRN